MTVVVMPPNDGSEPKNGTPRGPWRGHEAPGAGTPPEVTDRSCCHPRRRVPRCFSRGSLKIAGERKMKTLLKIMIPLGLLSLAACVVVPGRPYHPYYGPRVGVYAPAPVVVVRP